MLVRVRHTWFAAFEFALSSTSVEEFYDASQKRDKNGRWTRTASPSIQDALTKIKGGSKYLKGIEPQRPGEELFTYQSRVLNALPPAIKHAVLARCRERIEPNQFALEGMNKFIQDKGLPLPKVKWSDQEASLDKAHRVVEAVKNTPRDENNPEYKAAYDDFKRQSAEMWDYMTRPVSEGGMGVKVSVWDERVTGKDDPYDNAAAQTADVENNRHIYINRGAFFIGENPASPTGTNHPWMREEEYFRFRAVHDFFGHVAVGTGFDRHGEYAAWMAHNAMYSGEGRRAMSTEYHAVNTHLWLTGTPMPQDRWGIILKDDVVANVYDAEGNVVRK